jgi:hypothetical protein
MKRALLIIISAIVLMSFTACGQSTTPVTPDQSDIGRTAEIVPDYYYGYTTVPLIVGQDDGSLGDVTVYINEENLYFDVALTEEAQAAGWWISETHVAVYTSLDDFPLTKKGNPKVGQYAESIELPVGLIWDIGTILCISVHASLQKIVNGEVVQDETGWGEGTQFDGNSWAMYFTYEIWKNPPLPEPGEYVNLWIYPNEVDYYTDVHLTGVPDGDYVVSDGQWPGWCADFSHVIYYQPNSQYWYYDFQLYSSYGYEYWPDGLKTFMNSHGWDSDGDGDPGPVDWCRINWILNNKGEYTADEIQDAIWWFTDGGGNYTNNDGEYPPQEANDLAVLAMADGGGFLPGPGENMALILYKSGTQIIFIEIDP